MEFIFFPLLIKRIVYLLLVTASALVILFCFPEIHSYWVLYVALSLSLLINGESFYKRLKVMGLTGLSIVLTAFISGFLAESLLLVTIYLTLVTIICVYFSLKKIEYFLPLFFINLFAIIASYPHLIVENVLMVIFGLLGTLIALIYQIIFWPHFVRNKLQFFFMKSLQSLKLLNNDIFACFLQSDYPDNIYLYERRIHVRKNCFMQSICKLRRILNIQGKNISEDRKKTIEAMIRKLELLYETMLDYGQLRRRVGDHTTFGVCNDELTHISQEISKIFLEINAVFRYKNPLLDTQGLAIKIKELEENYQNALHVVAREPLVFMLFIASLKIFNQELASLYGNATEVRGALR